MAYKRENGVTIPVPGPAGGGGTFSAGNIGLGAQELSAQPEGWPRSDLSIDSPVSSPLPAYRGPNPHGGDASVGDRPIPWPDGPTPTKGA